MEVIKFEMSYILKVRQVTKFYIFLLHCPAEAVMSLKSLHNSNVHTVVKITLP